MKDEEFKLRLELFGRKLRAYAKWSCTPCYYSSNEEAAIEQAKADLANQVANALDEAFNIDSNISGMKREEIHELQTEQEGEENQSPTGKTSG